VGKQLDELFEGVDDLIKRVADTEDPEIRRIRAKVHASMAVAKTALEDGAAMPVHRRTPPFDDDTGDDPDQGLSVALLVGVGLGVIMSMQQ
jgi:ElaB/YqjD/DUF883 family membrane-anchored ribosome-binding protein